MNKIDILHRIVQITREINQKTLEVALLENEKLQLKDELLRIALTSDLPQGAVAEGLVPAAKPVETPPPPKVADLPRCDVEVNLNFTSAKVRNASESDLLKELQNCFQANPDKKLATSTLMHALHRGHSEVKARLERLVKAGVLLTSRCRSPHSNRVVDGFWLNPSPEGNTKNLGLPMMPKAKKKKRPLATETYETAKQWILDQLRMEPQITLKRGDTSPFGRTTFYVAMQRMVKEGLLMRENIPGEHGKKMGVYRLP